MFNTVILFAGPADHSFLSTVIASNNPRVAILPVFTLADLLAIDQKTLRSSRLITFARSEAVPQSVVGALGFGAYAFAAGTPDYPDAECALEEGAMYFGGTMYRLTDADAALPIVDIELFSTVAEATYNGLREMSFGVLLNMFLKYAAPLALQADALAERAPKMVESYTFRNALRSRRSLAAMAGAVGQAAEAARGRRRQGFAWT